MIKFENGKYVVYSEKGRIFGRYDTIKEAKKRIQMMEFFKHLNKKAMLIVTDRVVKKIKNTVDKHMIKRLINEGDKYTVKPDFKIDNFIRKSVNKVDNADKKLRQYGNDILEWFERL